MNRSTFLKIVTENKHYGSVRNLDQYLSVLFGDMDFTGKSFLDIGGGSGVFTHYAALMGAKRAVCMEPEFDGSTSGVTQSFNKVTSELGFDDIAELDTRVLQDFDGEPFDIVLSHNSINHLNEEACQKILVSPSAKQDYITVFENLYGFCEPGAKLIVCDCGRRNFFSDIGITNPFMKTIEWEKHQQPEVWAELLEHAGFKLDAINWNTFNTLGKLGPPLLGHFIPSYLTLSHFRMYLHK